MKTAQSRDDRWTVDRWLEASERKLREDSTPSEGFEIDGPTLDLLFEVAVRVGMGTAERRPLSLSEVVDHMLDQLEGVGRAERLSGKPSRKVA